MEFVRLSEEQRQSFDQDGFLVVRNVLDKEQVAQLTEAGDRLAGNFLHKPELPGKPEYNHLDLRPGLFTEEAVFGLLSHAPTVPYVVQLLSPNIHLHSTALIYKRPSNLDGPAFRRGWHRDIRIPKDLGHQFLPRVGIKVCYCLTDFQKPNSGMTLLARGTHMRTAPLELQKGKVDPNGVEVVDLQVNAGDAFLFDNRLFHTAAPNLSERTSKVLMYGYAYRWMKQEVYLETPEPKLLASSDPVQRQLLGFYRDIDTTPWALRSWAKKAGVLPAEVPWTVDVDQA